MNREDFEKNKTAKFKVIAKHKEDVDLFQNIAHAFPIGTIVELSEDDGSDAPLFRESGGFFSQWVELIQLEVVAE